MNQKLNSLYNAWRLAESKVDGLKEVLEDKQKPPKLENLPAIEERLATFKRLAQDAKGRYMVADDERRSDEAKAGELPTQQIVVGDLTPADLLEAELAFRKQIAAILAGEYKHVSFY